MTSQKRIRVRNLDAAQGFSLRLGILFRSAQKSLDEIADELGGFRIDTLSKLSTCRSHSIPLDLLAALAVWAIADGYSLVWLFAGQGEMMACAGAASINSERLRAGIVLLNRAVEVVQALSIEH